ncbi:hypothetical protein GALMADRAFT_68997 [Galerina marginata CBS 339.88]|uniref:Ubiquitin-like domain-containing protein n=1 Tax=Galerina marginata (strain CBS 339.88) TaxID=685588 RepID=A0A067SXQ8_GALM3|nr:hypothetical protein GALMADRAFT_68997 [Galerina marginata CBS 339.88]
MLPALLNPTVFAAFIKMLTGKTISFPLALATTLAELKQFIQDKEGIPPDQQRFIFAGREFDDSRPLSGFGVVKECTLHLVLSLRGGGDNLGGIGVGGRISQKINKKPLPPIAYNYRKAARLHVTIINASHFTTLTGLSPPRSPVSATTYLK